MKKTVILILACVCLALNASAQQGSGRLSAWGHCTGTAWT